jgi:nucleoside-diphosphate-sugar epimerase
VAEEGVMQLREKRIVVTRGEGFLGQNVVRSLEAHGCADIVVPRRAQHDLTREAIERGEPKIVCWGDGTPTREFLYMEDCAEAIVLAMEHYDGAEPVNIGAGFEMSIKELVEVIVELTGFRGQIVWDTSKPNGQPRRCLDTSRAWEWFGFRGKTDFRQGASAHHRLV